MKEPNLLRSTSVLTVSVFIVLGMMQCAAAAERPNVVFVLTDDQGYGDLSCHGNPILETPYLDRLAQQSVRFTDFHVAPMCTPTRAELMTGCSALANGAYCACSGRTFLRRGMPTMPEVFSATGYETALFGKWHLGDNSPHRPEDRGWRLVAGKELYDVSHDPGQQTDVAAKYPGVVAKMRAHYQRWWADIEPRLDEFERLTLGSDRENPVRLTSLDWLADKLVPAAQPFDIRGLGVPVVEGSLPGGRPMPLMNGFWNVEIQRGGRYRFLLRRWPKEAGAPINAPLPEYRGIDGTFPEGKALPAARARLKIGDMDVSKDISKRDKAAEFVVDLEPGNTHLQTWFLDAAGNELCGAFYVEVFRLP